MKCYYLKMDHNMCMCLKATNLNTNVCDRNIFPTDDMFLIVMNIEFSIPLFRKSH
jgi:hypothetical protein